MSLLFAALTLCILPGAADAKKKKPDKIGVASYNLYLGSDLGPATAAATTPRTDLFADEVGFVLKDVLANDFVTRAKQIAKDLTKRKVDLVGLQEAAFWKLQTPTDGSGFSPTAQRALNPVADYVQILLEELNRKAKTGKECKKQDIPKAKCYKGYTLVIDQQEADLEFLGDFDNDPGADGVTCDLSSGTCPPPPNPSWAQGNDDTGVNLGEPQPVVQCADGIDNDTATEDPDDGADWPTDPDCAGNLDGVEAIAGNQTTAAFPQDANFDSHALATTPNNVDGSGIGTDPSAPPLGTARDCVPLAGDTNPSSISAGPFAGTPWAAANQPVCLFHGIDGDLSLTMRDAIIKRKGAGVKTRNARSSNFTNTFQVTIAGSPIKFTRGWTAADAKVRGKSFTFVNTHLESESVGSVREDQAAELVAPGGPATAPTTVLVGDLNSDPTREPTNLPNGDGGSNIAINRLLNAGFSFVTQTGLTTGGHGELLSDQSNTLGDGWIDHILTNNPSSIKRKGSAQVIDTFANGLWNSDHGGVFVRIKGKKKK